TTAGPRQERFRIMLPRNSTTRLCIGYLRRHRGVLASSGGYGTVFRRFMRQRITPRVTSLLWL
ncbi:MAG: hypothetical protein NZ949_03745, partial [Candidatus Kapabacteria bacterium]|nr:hypothetical protein [Candidatus Kapabacteria bacterium]MDW7996359.1 hypothetical protein [Bacteroidota bacterium]